MADCTCPHGEGSLGMLEGINMGRGTLRLSTTPDCPKHDTCRGLTAEVRRADMAARPWSVNGGWCPIHGSKGCPSNTGIGHRPEGSSRPSDEVAS